MIKTTNSEVICPYCGESRVIEISNDDGRDYYGHHRGSERTIYVDNEYCSCKAGQMLKEKCTINPMCVNCKYLYGCSSCINEKLIESLNSKFNLFEIGDRISIKDVYDSCEFHELNEKIILDLFTIDTVKNDIIRLKGRKI